MCCWFYFFLPCGPRCRCSFFFFKQKTAYEFKCDWSSDVCSSDLGPLHGAIDRTAGPSGIGYYTLLHCGRVESARSCRHWYSKATSDWRFDGLTALVSIAAGKAADLVVLAGQFI